LDADDKILDLRG